jgi:amino acid transporter
LSFLADTAKSQISTEETRSVIEWLCSQPSDGAQSSLETALSVRVPGTGTWVLSSTAYEKWMQTEVCTMWITGPPGSGKTLLSTTIIENLRLSHPPPKSAVLYFFCDHRDSSKRTAESFLVSIAKQLLDTSPECLSKAKELFDDNKKQGGRKLDRSRHIEAIRLLLENFDELFVVVDGLDEASEGEQIVDVLTNVHNLGLQKGKATKIILSSRYDIRLQRRSSRIVSVRLALEENMRPDIEHFINCELHNRVNRGTLKLRNKNLMFTIEHQIGLRAGT